MHRIEHAGQFAPDGDNAAYVEQLRVPHLSVGTYSIPARGRDTQEPHTEDEVYVITRGEARLWTPTEELAVGPGDVIFVPAGEPHRFVGVTSDFCVLVVFGPAERTFSERQQGQSSDVY